MDKVVCSASRKVAFPAKGVLPVNIASRCTLRTGCLGSCRPTAAVETAVVAGGGGHCAAPQQDNTWCWGVTDGWCQGDIVISTQPCGGSACADGMYVGDVLGIMYIHFTDSFMAGRRMMHAW
jgi:hypothetical protein